MILMSNDDDFAFKYLTVMIHEHRIKWRCDWMHIDVSNDNEHKYRRREQAASQATFKTILCCYGVWIICNDIDCWHTHTFCPFLHLHSHSHLLTHSHHFSNMHLLSKIRHISHLSLDCNRNRETAILSIATTTAAAATVKHTLYYLVKLLSWHGDSVVSRPFWLDNCVCVSVCVRVCKTIADFYAMFLFESGRQAVRQTDRHPIQHTESIHFSKQNFTICACRCHIVVNSIDTTNWMKIYKLPNTRKRESVCPEIKWLSIFLFHSIFGVYLSPIIYTSIMFIHIYTRMCAMCMHMF